MKKSDLKNIIREEIEKLKLREGLFSKTDDIKIYRQKNLQVNFGPNSVLVIHMGDAPLEFKYNDFKSIGDLFHKLILPNIKASEWGEKMLSKNPVIKQHLRNIRHFGNPNGPKPGQLGKN